VTKPPPKFVPEPSWDSRSETPRVDAFIDQLPIIPMTDPLTTASAVREVLVAWSDFARELERELQRKVWPH